MIKKKIKSFLHSKFLFRRLVIIITVVVLLFVLMEFTSLMIRIFNQDSEDVVLETTETLETEENTTLTEEVPTEEDSSGESTENTTENTTENSTEVTTETPTRVSTEVTTEAVGESNSLDFSQISFYIQRFNYRYVDYAMSNQSLDEREVVLAVNMNLDFPFYHYIEKIGSPDALEVLCNKYYQLSSDFTPSHLVAVPAAYHVSDGKEYKLKQNALDAFKNMADAAKESGLNLKIISAYRSNAFQSNLYNKYVTNNGKEAADRFSARPGHSEHETGLAIDINDVSQSFENTDEFKWLLDNAHLYGYILRYPKGKERLTGYMYEPWHYRYLGVDLATKVKTSGLTYDEYYAMVILK